MFVKRAGLRSSGKLTHLCTGHIQQASCMWACRLKSDLMRGHWPKSEAAQAWELGSSRVWCWELFISALEAGRVTPAPGMPGAGWWKVQEDCSLHTFTCSIFWSDGVVPSLCNYSLCWGCLMAFFCLRCLETEPNQRICLRLSMLQSLYSGNTQSPTSAEIWQIHP